MPEALGSRPAPHHLGLMAHSCDPSTWGLGVEAGVSKVQDHLPLLRELEASLGYMKLEVEARTEF